MLAIAAIFLLGTSIMPGPAPADPPRTWPASWRSVSGPRLAVADAASARSGDLHLITGGFTEGLEATPAIQYLHESRGWQPIGQAMLHPRAGHSLVKIDDERIMVLGGWSGRLPDEVTQRIDAEIFEHSALVELLSLILGEDYVWTHYDSNIPLAGSDYQDW